MIVTLPADEILRRQIRGYLDGNDGATFLELADGLNLPHSAVKRIVRALVKNGLIESGQSRLVPGESRELSVYRLTLKGRIRR